MIDIKKIIRSLAVSVLALAALSGCGCRPRVKTELKNKREIVLAVRPDSTGAFSQAAREFSNASPDTDVRVMELGTDSTDYYRIISSVMLGGEISADIFVIEDIWLNDFVKNDYLSPMDEFVNIDKSEYIKGAADTADADGTNYFLPIDMNVGVFFKRRSSEIKSFADSSPGKTAVYSEDTVENFTNLIQIIKYCGSTEGGLKMYKNLAAQGVQFSDFCNGDIPSALSYTLSQKKLSSEFSSINGMFDADIITSPGGNVCSVARVNGFVVNKRTANSDGVREFLKYINQSEVQKNILKTRGTAPVKKSDYDNDMVLDYCYMGRAIKPVCGKLEYRKMDSDFMGSLKEVSLLLDGYLKGDIPITEAAAAVNKLID